MKEHYQLSRAKSNPFSASSATSASQRGKGSLFFSFFFFCDNSSVVAYINKGGPKVLSSLSVDVGSVPMGSRLYLSFVLHVF